ncbi:MAG: PBSX family phage terminase large subunit, partial [Oscillospiraceae bacterium]
HTNRYYMFGGKDESSYQLIQGITLAGVLFDEVALMPRSFVEQALARCSVTGSKFWFNCNPDSSEHWFFKEWVDDNSETAKQKNRLHLHFTMQNNYSLDKSVIERYERMYTGVFYDRYIKGLWVLADGLVYQMFKDDYILEDYTPSPDATFYVSCDYGILNPTSMGLWALEPDKAVRIKEYYWDGRKQQPRTDEEHYQALEKLVSDYDIQSVIVDPSASSFIECIRRHQKFSVKKANNSVVDGIRNVSTLIGNGKLFICESCKDLLRELKLYCWDSKSVEDKVIKENDHACDDMRYFVMGTCRTTLLRELDYENT